MADHLWTAQELVAATGGVLQGSPGPGFTGVSIDSRSIAPGEIFIAIAGDARDGHEFAASALKAGAGLAIVSRPDDEMRAAGALLVVADPLEALRQMARAARERSAARIVAVTGSVGKTSTKEALRLVLAPSGEVHASAASYNNHWGVPLSLARLPRAARYAVFEVGMNHAGEITPLTQMVRPHVAIITTIAPSHLGNFANLQGIADAKAEIFAGVVAGGAVLLNRDNAFYDHLAAAARAQGIARVHSFGRAEGADVRLEKLVLHAECSCLTASVFGEPVTCKIGTPGEHVALNSLAVLGAVDLLGADLARAALEFGRLAPPKGRGVRHRLKVQNGAFTLVDESYNANPASMRAALSVLARANTGKHGRRIAVMGDMLELGDESGALHAGLCEAVREFGIDRVYCAGPMMQKLWDKLTLGERGHYAPESSGLTESLLAEIAPGDVVMVKGSLGSRMGPVVEAIRARFAPMEQED